MKFSEVLKPDGVLIDVTAPTKDKLLRFLSLKAAAALGISEDDVLGALESREKLGSTGIGAGIAMPHAAVKGVAAPYALLVRLNKPIAFDAIDGEPVDLVCLILMPPGETSQSLNLLSQFARQLRSSETVKTLRSTENATEAFFVFKNCEP